jgi:hypothetical protein
LSIFYQKYKIIILKLKLINFKNKILLLFPVARKEKLNKGGVGQNRLSV